MPRLQCSQRQQKSTGTLRSPQNANRRMPQNYSAWSKRLDRRNEVINEALAEEVRRGEQRKKRSDRATEAVPETESAAPEPKENPIEPEANSKRRLLVKSASLTANGSGQRTEKRDPRWRAPSANTPVAATTQEAVDGHREKAMRIASVEQIEFGDIMELSITGQVLR